MIMKTAAILLFPFIFGITTLVYADSVKSINNNANQETVIKMDENKVAMQEKKGISENPIQTSKQPKPEVPSGIYYKDTWWIIDDAKLNFLKILEEKRKTRIADYLEKMIYSYGFSQNAWGEKFLKFKEVEEVKSTNPGVSSSHLGSYSLGNNYFEERRILETFKLLQFKREGLSKEIFMGFHFSFSPVSGHMFLETNAIPSFEKGSRFIIPF